MITPEIANSLIDYNPETGALRWRERAADWFSSDRARNAWNVRFSGKLAGSKSRMGYVHLSIHGSFYQAHRLIWLMMTGEKFPGDIDHINGDKSDNRWSNLRAVSHAENTRNRALGVNNSSGVIGVGWNGRYKKWQARIMVCGDSKSLGYFDEFDAAASARKAAERQFGYHENHGRS